MMISSNDSSAVFALLTAISSPEKAKASLIEISEAYQNYNKTIEDFRIESKKATDEFEKKKALFDEEFLSKKEEIDLFNDNYDKRTKQLEDQFAILSKRQATLVSAEAALKIREKDISSKEILLLRRESNVSSREIEVEKLYELSQATQQEYSIKLKKLKDLI